MAKKYLFFYSGGNPPKSPAEGKALMDAWMAYYGKIGASIADGGAPFAPGSKTLGPARPNGGSGFTIVNAENFDAAMALTEGHPHIAHGGGIEVFEIAPIPGM